MREGKREKQREAGEFAKQISVGVRQLQTFTVRTYLWDWCVCMLGTADEGRMLPRYLGSGPRAEASSSRRSSSLTRPRGSSPGHRGVSPGGEASPFSSITDIVLCVSRLRCPPYPRVFFNASKTSAFYI